MKFGHMQTEAAEEAAEEAAKAEGGRPSELPKTKKSGWWHIGMALFICGNLFNFASFSFANQSLLAGNVSACSKRKSHAP
jgi:hypothetical protein